MCNTFKLFIKKNSSKKNPFKNRLSPSKTTSSSFYLVSFKTISNIFKFNPNFLTTTINCI